MEIFIRSLIIAGYINKTIKSRCKKKGYPEPTDEEIEVLRNTIKLENEIEKVNKKEPKEDKKKGKMIIPLFTETESYFDFANRIGVETEYQNVGELIAIVQKLTANIFIKQAVCLLRGLELQSEGKNIDLEILFKGYDIAFKAIDKAWGMQNLIDLNAAIQSVRNKGFTIDVSPNTYLPEISKTTENN